MSAEAQGAAALPTAIRYLDAVRATEAGRAYKRQALARLVLKPGDFVLDVGCGAGDDVRELAALVGESGRAVGVDSDYRMIAEAWRRQGRASRGVEFKVGDAQRLPFEDGCFHACRSDRVFQHLADPVQALRELVRVARPGAAIVVSEPDWETLTLDAGDRATTRRVVQFIADRSVRQGWIGRQLPRVFKQQGLLDVRVDAAVVTLTDYELADTLWGLTRNASAGRDAGSIGTEEMVAWLRDLQESGREGRFFGAHLGFVVSGRKP